MYFFIYFHLFIPSILFIPSLLRFFRFYYLFVVPLPSFFFLMQRIGGFRLLNLKNDLLRKKFDSMKYDVKKIEEVVYDISVRGLVKKIES